MDERKHTKGPWIIDEKDSYIIKTEDGTPICSCFDNVDDPLKSVDEEESLFNTYLCRAAPEMCAALDTALATLHSYQCGNSSTELAKDVADHLAKVVAKAEGLV